MAAGGEGLGGGAVVAQRLRTLFGPGIVGQLDDLIGNHIHLLANLGAGFLQTRGLSRLLPTAAANEGETDETQNADDDDRHPGEPTFL